MEGNPREAADRLAQLGVDLFELHGSILSSFTSASAMICDPLTDRLVPLVCVVCNVGVYWLRANVPVNDNAPCGLGWEEVMARFSLVVYSNPVGGREQDAL